jgi:Zn-finger nucleic acid-binding protein
MNCPDCGAAMEPVANRNFLHCSHCNNFEFPEDTGDGIHVTGDPVEMSCPVCEKPLQSAVIEGETVAYCGRCRGFATFNHIFGAIVSKRRALHGPNEARFDPIDPAELQRALHCPVCKHRMEAHPYFGGGNVVVDTCDRCETIWLDAGELATIERYIPHAVPHVPSTEPDVSVADDTIPSLF